MVESVIKLVEDYRVLNLSQVVNYDKFNHYAITHHSTVIEGSSLTSIETDLLLEQDITPKGKPLTHSLMTKDHYIALLFVLEKAKAKTSITVDLVKAINALVLKHTGAVYNTILGVVDSTKGEFRLGNVRVGNRYFANYSKVPKLTENLCTILNQRLNEATTLEVQLLLSFQAHFDFVSIHPFYDGNGRTARLLMNYIQTYFGLPLGIVFKEDKEDYIKALEQTRKKEDIAFFHNFMLKQYQKYLQSEIDNYQQAINPPKSGRKFSLVF